jgi:uncharacterized protein YPO0396
MMNSTIEERVERVNHLLHEIDIMNDRARLLMAEIEIDDRREKDSIRYAGIL